MEKTKQVLKLRPFSSDDPETIAAVTCLKQRVADRKATEADSHAEAQQAHQSVLEVQESSSSIAGTVDPSQTQHKARGLQIASPAPAKMADERQPPDEDDWGRAVENDDQQDDSEEIASRYQNPEALVRDSEVIQARQQAESNKENEAQLQRSQPPRTKKRHLIDRQPNAKRLAPVDSQGSGSNGEQSDTDALSQDAGFQPSHQPANLPSRSAIRSHDKRTATEARTVRRSPSRRPQFQASPRRNNQEPAASSARLLQEHQSLSSQVLYRQMKENAKIIVASQQPKRVQTRKPWSELEIDTLLNLIRENGISYAHLKNIDGPQGILKARDQVALKDKARNMKMDFLKTGDFLPKNFERIPLSRILIERLESLGIEYNPDTGHRIDGKYENEDEDSDGDEDSNL